MAFVPFNNVPANNGGNSQRKLYIGSTNVKVIMYNPTLSEIQESGKYPYLKKEPGYDMDKTTLHKFFIEFITKEGDTVNTVLDIWVSKDHNVSERTGKKQYIDVFGQTSWLEVTAKGKPINNKSDYFDFKTAQPASRGLDRLVEFLYVISGYSKANVGIRKDNEEIQKHNRNIELGEEGEIKELRPLYLLELDYDAIISGDNTQVKDIMEKVIEAGNEIHVALGVKDGLYQEVYSGKFANPCMFSYYPVKGDLKNAKSIVKQIEKDKEFASSSNRDMSYYPTDDMSFRIFDASLVGTDESTLDDTIPGISNIPGGFTPPIS